MEKMNVYAWKKEEEGVTIDLYLGKVRSGRLILKEGCYMQYEVFSKDEHNATVYYLSHETPPFGYFMLKEHDRLLPVSPIDPEEARNLLEVLEISLEGRPDEHAFRLVEEMLGALRERLRIFEEKKQQAKTEKDVDSLATLFIEISAFLGFESVGFLKNRIRAILAELTEKGNIHLHEDDEFNEFLYHRVVRGERYIYELEDAFGIKFVFNPSEFSFTIEKRTRG